MKKILLLYTFFIFLLFPSNTKALDYLGSLKDQVPEFYDYPYHTFYAHNEAYFSIILSSEVPYIYSPTDTRFFPRKEKCYLFDKNSLTKQTIACNYNTSTYTYGKFEMIIQHDYGLKYYSNSEVIKKANYSSIIEPEPSPTPTISPNPTPEEGIFATREEFYSLLVLVALIPLMLLLKWCFPMKGGKNL